MLKSFLDKVVQGPQEVAKATPADPNRWSVETRRSREDGRLRLTARSQHGGDWWFVSYRGGRVLIQSCTSSFGTGGPGGSD